MKSLLLAVTCCLLISVAHSENTKPEYPATEKVRRLLESVGLSNKDAYLLPGEAIHEHVSTACPKNWKED